MTLEVLKALAVILEFWSSGVLHEPRFLQELPNGPVLLEDAM